MKRTTRCAGSTLRAAVAIAFGGIGASSLQAVEPADGTVVHHHPQGVRQHGHHEHATVSNLPVGITLSTAWDSSYVSEGRDNLDGDGLVGTTLELSYKSFALGAWYADSPDNTYDEFNAFLESGFEIGEFDFYVGYTHLEFMDDDEDDDEVSAGVAYNGLACGIVPAIDWYYSFESEGSFIELSAAREFEVASWLTLEPGVVFGINEGYIAEGHDGANHIAAILAATVPVADNVELGSYLSYNWAIDSDESDHPDDELLEDFFFGGVSLTLSF